MRWGSVTNETKLDRLLAIRLGDIETHARRMLGLSRVPLYKYEVSLPEGFNSAEIQRIAHSIRGESYRPAIFIHGVLPRSGTNYLSDLLEMHQDVHPHPHRFWEFPLLSVTDKVMYLQDEFARVYQRNAEVLKPLEFAAYLSSGLMKDLQQQVGPEKTMLFKFPFVHYIDLFRVLFPKDYLVLLLRDGRDVVASSLKTFSHRKGIFKKGFSGYCREWQCASETILRHNGQGRAAHPRTLVVRYEDLFRDPERGVGEILQKIGLSPDRYDFARLRNMPVRGSSELAKKGDKPHWKPVERAATFNPLGRWRDWSPHQKQQFKTIAGKALVATGYETSENW